MDPDQDGSFLNLAPGRARAHFGCPAGGPNPHTRRTCVTYRNGVCIDRAVLLTRILMVSLCRVITTTRIAARLAVWESVANAGPGSLVITCQRPG